VTSVIVNRQALIDGEWADGGDGVIEVRSPHSGEVVGTVARCTATQVDQAVAAARKAFPEWKRMPLLERTDLLYKAYEICKERNEAIARQISLEMGKTIRESREEMVEYACEHFKRAAEDVLRYRGQFLPSTQERSNNKRIVVSQEPAGVVAVVTPWNFPVDIAAIAICYALAIGDTVVWKPSEYAPLSSAMLADIFHEAGFPPGTVNMITGEGDVGRALVAHPDVSAVVFTGSTNTGLEVASTIGLKKRVLELGGNGPIIIRQDADLDKAADAAIVGCFYLAGQCCTAAERLLVHESVRSRSAAGPHAEPAARGSAGRRHRHGPAVQRRRSGPDPAACRRGRRPWRHRRAGRHQQRAAFHADRSHRRHSGHGDRTGRDVRPGRAGHRVLL
jgi:succinate-semialdehyde dehydrogenase / glutarate-semialdehyde dehydrogenase